MKNNIKERLTALAGRVVLGASIKQTVKAQKEQAKDPTPEEIAEARAVALAFAERLRSLAAARFNFDLSKQVERGLRRLDFASTVARGEQLPDPGEIESAARRSKFHLEAVFQLANREAGDAARAVNLLRGEAMRLAHRAKREAVEIVKFMLPDAFDDPEGVAAQSRLVKSAFFFINEMQTIPGLKLVNAELFGVRLPHYRIDELPETPQVMPPDKLDPHAAASDVENVIAAHDRAQAFLASILNSPGDAMKETGTQA
jgi:hypothetical protein